jgi:hypothetical protein
LFTSGRTSLVSSRVCDNLRETLGEWLGILGPEVKLGKTDVAGTSGKRFKQKDSSKGSAAGDTFPQRRHFLLSGHT